MSLAAIRAALETELAAITPAIDTAWEGVPYTPTTGTPYQAVNLFFAEPENNENNATFRQGGFMQVALRYPLGVGPSAAETRAKLVRDTFPRGKAMASGGITVQVDRTPEVIAAPIDGDRLVRIVRVRFYANNLA